MREDRSPAPRFVVATALLIGGVAGRDGAAGQSARVDTLPGGTVVVSNPAGGLWQGDDTRRWRLVEDLRIGVVDGEAPYMFEQVESIIPGTDGRIRILDWGAFELRLFDRNGRILRSVGRQGGGPGEFTRNPCAFAGPDDEVWVEDGSRRWQRFDRDGNLLGSHRVSPDVLGCGVRIWTPDGRFLVENTFDNRAAGEWSSLFVVHRLGADGELVPGDTVLRPAIPRPLEYTRVRGIARTVDYVPFTHRPAWVLGPSGDFWVTDGRGSYEIRRQTTTGDTLLIIRRPHEPIPIPGDVRDARIQRMHREGWTFEGGFDVDDVPRHYPPFDRFVIGTDGTLWVRRQLGDGVTGLDVFDADGIYLGAVVVPPEFERMSIRHADAEYLYAVYRDELDVQYVVRLQIQRRAG